MYKIKNNLSPSLMKLIFPANPFQSTNPRTVLNGTEAISYRGPIVWSMVPNEIKCSKSLVEFKARIRTWEPKDCTSRLCKIYVKDIDFI